MADWGNATPSCQKNDEDKPPAYEDVVVAVTQRTTTPLNMRMSEYDNMILLNSKPWAARSNGYYKSYYGLHGARARLMTRPMAVMEATEEYILLRVDAKTVGELRGLDEHALSVAEDPVGGVPGGVKRVISNVLYGADAVPCVKMVRRGPTTMYMYKLTERHLDIDGETTRYVLEPVEMPRTSIIVGKGAVVMVSFWMFVEVKDKVLHLTQNMKDIKVLHGGWTHCVDIEDH
jgi:hypothetical protein